MSEIWKSIKGYGGLYKISNKGRVKSFMKNNEMILNQSRKDYPIVTLWNNDKSAATSVSSLVWDYFGDKKREYEKHLIVHKNGKKTDNRIENLQLVSRRDFSRNNSTSKYTGVSRKKGDSKWRSQISINGKAVGLGRFGTELEAAKAYQKKLDEINLQKEK